MVWGRENAVKLSNKSLSILGIISICIELSKNIVTQVQFGGFNLPNHSFFIRNTQYNRIKILRDLLPPVRVGRMLAIS